MQKPSFIFYVFPTELHILIQEFIVFSRGTWLERVHYRRRNLHVQVIINTSEQVAGPDTRAKRTFTEAQISPPDLCLTAVHKHSAVLVKTKELIRHRPGTM